MKYLNLDPSIVGAEDAEDKIIASELLERKLAEIDKQLEQLSANNTAPSKRAELLLDYADTCLELQKDFTAWQMAYQAFQLFIPLENWEGAVQACHILFKTEQPDSLAALGNGVWLAVTFPIDPELSVLMLESIVSETPDDSDGGAVAAATAHYIVDLRTEGQLRENLLFFTNQLLAKVARRHSQVNNQTDFESWFRRLELDSPPDFLGRLAQVLEVIVQDNWWIDREALRTKLPIH
ncbi:hypothetical protein THII_3048 [Thioploca ingrica]|uniref:Uncharacterized protein n=1 Tax=Thioploca ingrica TaxID=40754 RepID=A0A090APD6_9GAMM|nr:hypothetical protein THII_3048 [Thioploca ingrica]